MLKTTKEFAKLYLPIAVGLILVAAWFLHARNQNHLETVQIRQQSIVAQEARIIERDISARLSDTRFLARLTARVLTEEKAQGLGNLEDIFADFARSRQSYFSIRYIDQTGMERVRIDRTFSGPTIRSKNTLQLKKGRYYFTEGSKGELDDVHISMFDLNIEHGKLEEPHRPTLRFTSPVFDARGNNHGIVVINFDGNSLLQRIRTRSAGMEGVLLFTNRDGYWLIAPQGQGEWGHILDASKGASMPNRFPMAWETVSTREAGLVNTPAGLFSFETIDIIPNAMVSKTLPLSDKRRWKIMTWVLPAQLIAPWSTVIIVMTILGLILMAAGCWHLAENRIRQEEVETRLRDSEEQMLAISQSAQDAIVMIDDQDRITYWNPGAERLLGYRSDEILDEKLHNILPPKDLRPQANKAIRQFATTGNGRSIGQVIEFEALHKNGTLVPVEVAVSSLQLKQRWYTVGSMRDVTRRKCDELALRRSEETSRALLNAPTESAMLIEPDGTLVSINEIGALRLGNTVEGLVGKNIFDMLPYDRAQERKAVIDSVIKSGQPATLEDNRAGRQLLSNVYPVKGTDQSIERLAIFSRDVTEQRFAEAALKQSEQRFRDVSEAVGEYIWETNKEGEYTFITEDVTLVLGYTPKELLGRTPLHLLPKEDVERFDAWSAEFFEERKPFSNFEIRNITKDGRLIWLQINGVPYSDEQGNFMGYRGAAMNITDTKLAEDAIKASERKLRALAESAYDAIIMIDTNGHISFWNHAAEKLFGFTEDEVMGNEIHSLIAPPEDRDKAETGLYRFAMTGSGPAVGAVEETIGMHKNGSRITIERSVSGFKLGDDWYAVATIRDITERKATEAKLRELATTDSLTGLYNRRRFLELSEREFAKCLRYNRSLAMFMIDIDHFKNVNDTHGHDAGDEVLRSLSEISIMALRNADIVGRLGGEEFGVLLPETGKEAAIEVAERLRTSVERAVIATNSAELTITVSIGVATMPPDTKDIQALLKRADVALYDAKQSGRNRVVSG